MDVEVCIAVGMALLFPSDVASGTHIRDVEDYLIRVVDRLDEAVRRSR